MIDENCFGSYIHGILDNPAVIERILSPFIDRKTNEEFNPAAFREEQYNLLANWLRKYLDVDKIYSIIQER